MDLEQWFDTFWATYPKDLSHGKKGIKTAALKAIQKLKPDDKEMNRIMAVMRELMRHDRSAEKMGLKPDRRPHASTFINSGYLSRIEDIESSSDMQDRQVKTCSCKRPAVIKNLCEFCYDEKISDSMVPAFKSKASRQANMEAKGLWRRDGESAAEWCRRCREYVTRSDMGKFIGAGTA